MVKAGTIASGFRRGSSGGLRASSDRLHNHCHLIVQPLLNWETCRRSVTQSTNLRHLTWDFTAQHWVCSEPCSIGNRFDLRKRLS